MRSVPAIIASVLAAAFGGALAVFGSYDDSPGGTLIGVLIVVAALVISIRRTSRDA